MCGCENHWNSAASCTCNCPEHYGRKIAPKPAEPTGLGAVVEDDRGDVWVRNNPYDDCKWRSGDGTWVEYADIDVVRVLSEGVTA